MSEPHCDYCGKDLKMELAPLLAERDKWKDEYENLCKFANDYQDRIAALESLLGMAGNYLSCRCNSEYNCLNCKYSKQIDAALGKEGE